MLVYLKLSHFRVNLIQFFKAFLNPNAVDSSLVNYVRVGSFLFQHAHPYCLGMLLDDDPEKSYQSGGMGLKRSGWKLLCIRTCRFMSLCVDKSWDAVRNENLCVVFFVVGKMQTQLTPKTHYKFYTNIEFF